MGDNIIVGQAGSVGRGSEAHDINFNQIWLSTSSQIDLSSLSNELELLREKMKEAASTPEQDQAVGAVASAQMAAGQGNGPQTIAYLSKAGRWAFDIASKIGVGLAVTALQRALGM